VGVIAAGAVTGALLMRGGDGEQVAMPGFDLPRRVGIVSLALFFALLVLLPAASALVANRELAIFDAFYRAGALVFGGGHVVLPLLEQEVVASGWVSRDAFLAGYGAAQAVPGPLFTFAAYLGAVLDGLPGGLADAGLALVAIFLPGFLLLVGALPFWSALRKVSSMRAAMAGANAAVVGLLAAAFYDPLLVSTVAGPGDALVAVAGFVALALWRMPPWVIVLSCAAAGAFAH
jgi:chromate transporter